MKHTCACCGKKFRPRGDNHRYCEDKRCQRARKTRWQKKKLVQDLDYRENQNSAQKEWKSKHPEYWREYRAKHPEYKQRGRGCFIALCFYGKLL